MTSNSKSNAQGGTDHSTHHLIEIREPPENMVALRNELAHPAHAEWIPYIQQGRTLEECLGRIGVKLNIALDGEYDANTLCGILCTGLRNKRNGIGSAELERIPGLVEVEIHERGETIELIDVEAENRKAKERESLGSVGSGKIIFN